MAQVKLSKYEVDRDLLPDICMKCGEPAAVRKKKQFAWYPPWIAILILGGLLPFAIVATIMTKRMKVNMPFCEQHRNYWLVRNLYGLIGLGIFLILGVAGFALAMALDIHRQGGGESAFGLICLGWGVLFLAWLVSLVIVQSGNIKPKEITDNTITLVKVHEYFADALDEDRRRDDELAREDDYDRPARPRRRSEDVYDPDAPRRRPQARDHDED
ncbi:MAG TPA: hypothetical protein VFA26_20530 [Gemmataceae bacterium]|nr:hypothetical protein [Gemmataceae bacterium]